MPQDCPRCGHTLEDQICAACGFGQPGTSPPISGSSLVRGYFSTVRSLLTEPRNFYRKMPVSGGIGGPLAFALVTRWIGAALTFLWESAMGFNWMSFSGSPKKSEFMSFLSQYIGSDIDQISNSARYQSLRDAVSGWAFSAGRVVVDPFLTLFSILVTSAFIYLGARIFVSPGKNGAPERIDYEAIIRIVSFASAPALLAVVPLVGGPLATLGVMILTIIGAQEVYRISTGRAIVVGLFPKLLIVVTFFSVVLLMIVAFAKILAGLF